MMGTFDDLSGSLSDTTVIKFGSEAEKRQIENLKSFPPWASSSPGCYRSSGA
jgi:hypothetical protein